MLSLSIALKVAATIFLALFPVVNPVGTALILSGITSGTDPTDLEGDVAEGSLRTRFSC